MRDLFRLPVAAMSLGACATISAPPPREGPVRIGQTAFVGGPKVRPVALIEDSRCAENARCVWAGRVVVRAEITTGAGTRTADLVLGQGIMVADGRLALVSVTPERRTARAIDRKAYRFAFQFQGGL